MKSDVPPIMQRYNMSGCTVYVPCGRLETYRTTDHGDHMWTDSLYAYLRSSCAPVVLNENETAAGREQKAASYIRFQRAFPLDEWVPLYLPFSVDSLWVKDGEDYYDIYNPYDAAEGGYFYLEELTSVSISKSETTGGAISGAVSTTREENLVKPYVPYLIRFSSKPDGYFAGKEIIFRNATDEYALQEEQLTETTLQGQGTVFRVIGNLGYANVVASKAYEFVTTGSGAEATYTFEYRGEPFIIPPFHFALFPTVEAAINPMLRPQKFAMRTSEQGGEVVTSVDNTMKGGGLCYERQGQMLTLHLAGKACRIISAQGEEVFAADKGAEEARVSLPSGMYIVYYEEGTQKIVM